MSRVLRNFSIKIEYVIITMFIISLIVMVSYLYVGKPEYKYMIYQGDKIYYTNEYTLDKNGCINFGNTNKDYTICGDYTIKENK